MADKSKLTKAGDVNIETVIITTSRGFFQNVTSQTIGFDIFEDLFSPFMSGKLYIRDSQELTNLLPLIGEETVDIKISTPEMPDGTAFNAQFVIFKMSDKTITSEREVVYTLHIISRYAIVDMNQKVSRAFSGPIGDIATEIIKSNDGLQYTAKEPNVEPTDNRTKFVANFWSPIRCLQYLCESAVSKTGSPSYVFYENKYGLNFLSLDTLYAEEVLFEFKRDNYTNVTNPTGGSTRNLSEDYKRLLELRVPCSFNYVERLKSGLYGSEIIYMDLLTRQYVHKGYAPDWSDGRHLNPFPVFSENVAARPKALQILSSQYYNNFDGWESDTANTKVIQKRKFLLAAAEANKCIIKVFGRTDYTAGQKIFLEIPKATQITKNENPLDWIQSGNYLIASVCHEITRTTYNCTMELIKDSYIIDVNKI